MKDREKLTFSLTEAAYKVGVGKDQIKRLVEEGELGTIAFDKQQKNRRIPLMEIERFIQKNMRYAR